MVLARCTHTLAGLHALSLRVFPFYLVFLCIHVSIFALSGRRPHLAAHLISGFPNRRSRGLAFSQFASCQAPSAFIHAPRRDPRSARRISPC